mmetsp:Transcript_22822/g.59684  ORF Transcript_22822/g.59684 Transcript_22822/m.59684 type:complete len:202 (+) Transcript_22822:1325-1930(+)
MGGDASRRVRVGAAGSAEMGTWPCVPAAHASTAAAAAAAAVAATGAPEDDAGSAAQLKLRCQERCGDVLAPLDPTPRPLLPPAYASPPSPSNLWENRAATIASSPCPSSSSSPSSPTPTLNGFALPLSSPLSMPHVAAGSMPAAPTGPSAAAPTPPPSLACRSMENAAAPSSPFLIARGKTAACGLSSCPPCCCCWCWWCC